jgi:branched-chain amino acid transport system permease protein
MARGMKVRLLKIVPPLLLLAILLALPSAGLGPNLLRLFFITFVFIITGIGWNLVGGFAGQVSFGFAVFYGLGAYATALTLNAGLNPFVSLLSGAVTSMVASFLFGLPTFRLRGPYFVIATIGVTEAVRVFMSNVGFTGGASGYRINEYGTFRQVEHYYTALIAVAVALSISMLISRSRFGLALRAIKQDQDAAADVGVNPYFFKLWAHAIAAGLTGIAGGIYARYAIFLDPGDVFAFQKGISILLIPVIGGIGTVWGPVLGGLVVGVVEEQLVVKFPNIHLLLYGTLLILIILFEPDGIVGLLRRITSLFRRSRDHSGSGSADKVLWGRSRLEGREL